MQTTETDPIAGGQASPLDERRRASGLALVAASVQVMVAGHPDGQRLARLAELALGAGADLCLVYVARDDGARRLASAAGAGVPEDLARLPWDAAPAVAEALHGGRPRPALLGAEPQGGLPAAALLAAPLGVGGRTVGALALVRLGGAPFDAVDAQVAQELAACAALAVDTLQLTESLAQVQFEHLNVAFREVPAAVWVAHDPACRVITGNRAAHEMLRMPYGANLSKSGMDPGRTTHFRVLRDGVELTPDQLPVQTAASTGVAVRDFEEDVVFDDGTVRTLLGNAIPLRDPSGQVYGAIATFFDISERKQAEAERQRLLAEAQAARAAAERAATQLARLQAITAGLAEAPTVERVAEVVLEESLAALGAAVGIVALLDEDSGELRAAAVLGRTVAAAAACERTVAALTAPLRDALAARAPLVLERAAEVAARYPQLVRPPAPGGGGAFVALPLLSGGRTLGGLAIGFPTDRELPADDRSLMLAAAQQCAQAIERARLYETEREAREAAEAALRLRDIFFSVAAHELKTPLTSLMGQAQLLERRAQRDNGLADRDRRSVSVIVGQAGRLSQMVNAMLDIARIEHGQLAIERAPVDLPALVRRVVEEVQPTLPGHEIAVEVADEPLAVVGDGLRLEQVLHNLVGNAAKYSPGGGAILVRLSADGAEARIAVADSGIGIPEEDVPRLFRRFYRAGNVERQQISGMGIGLYVVREIVALHGGDVTVESAVGRGSTFTVHLPLDPAGG